MSNIATLEASPVQPKPSIPLYTTEELKKYYERQMDQKFQRRKEKVQVVNGCEVYYRPTFLSNKFALNAPLVDDVLVEVTDVNTGKLMCKAYPYEVWYTVEKGYTMPVQSGQAEPKFASLGTFRMSAPEFCRTYEKFDSAD